MSRGEGPGPPTAGVPPGIEDARRPDDASHRIHAGRIEIAPIPAGALIAYPTSVAEVGEIVADATSRGAPLRIVGHGTWLGAGRPVDPRASPIVLESLRGIVEYVPGDLTLTALAGTPLADISRATAAYGQWLTFDPVGGATATLGAAFATASAGPLATGFGLPRDLALGVQMVSGTGDVIRGGGRVVKNVAGFDLTRLAVGSWGTLGVLTELTVRLSARPERDVTMALEVDEPSDAAVAALAEQVRGLPILPVAVELLSASLATALGLGARAVVLIRLAGNAPAVESQLGEVTALGAATEAVGTVWGRLLASEPREATTVRYSALPSRIGETWRAATNVIDGMDGAYAHASVARGIARCVLPTVDSQTVSAALSRAAGFSGRCVYERLPASLWDTLAPSATADRLSRGIRRAFDPHGVLNPGILGPLDS